MNKMIFKIGKYIISKYDKLNWITQEKVKVDPNHPLAKKHATSKAKTRYNLKLVGFYPTLLDAKQELGEIISLDCKDYKELCKWINKLRILYNK